MITIELHDSFSLRGKLSPAGLSRFLNRARHILGVAGEVEVLLSDDPTLRRLNRSFRGKNKATDVLSFPSQPEIFALHAGDLAISLETAGRQAMAYGHSLRDEVRILLLHGLLHLSGLDHETDTGEMAAREAALRRELHLPQTLIERASRSGLHSAMPMAKNASALKPKARKRKQAASAAAVPTPANSASNHFKSLAKSGNKTSRGGR